VSHPETEGSLPSDWVMRFANRISPGGRVLDVAAGSGRHARWLAAAGFDVVAVDQDATALLQCSGARVVCADLEAGPWPFASQTFDGIIVCNYLYRPLFAHLRTSLAARGVLVYETFAVGQEQIGRPRRAEFLLAAGELLQHCAGLHVLAYEDGIVTAPRHARIQRICALNTQSVLSGAQLAL
jgi:SAM-dependent methyltransferase